MTGVVSIDSLQSLSSGFTRIFMFLLRIRDPTGIIQTHSYINISYPGHRDMGGKKKEESFLEIRAKIFCKKTTRGVACGVWDTRLK